jgi:proteasome alpha subunit
MESIYLVSEDKTGIRHIKMAIIDNDTKTMRKVEEEEIEKYARMAKERSSK